MPKYRVVLEFEHPGKQVVNGIMINPPQEWDWPNIASDATNLEASVYELQVVEEFVPLEVRYCRST